MYRSYCCRKAGSLLQRRTYSSQPSSSSSVPLAKRDWGTARGPVNTVKTRLQEIKPSSSPSSSILSLRGTSSPRSSTRAPKAINADKIEIEEDHEGSWRPSLVNANPVAVRPEHLAHRRALKKEFPNGWSPPRKLSREAMDGLRTLHGHDPETFTTPFLASRFKISPEAVRKILRSKWEPDEKRKGKIAKKEVELREAWIERKRQEKAERRRRPVEMFMDAESDKLFMGQAGIPQEAEREPSVKVPVPRRV